jgi:hypothetical protein
MLSSPPQGYEVARVDVVLQLRPKPAVSVGGRSLSETGRLVVDAIEKVLDERCE